MRSRMMGLSIELLIASQYMARYMCCVNLEFTNQGHLQSERRGKANVISLVASKYKKLLLLTDRCKESKHDKEANNSQIERSLN